MITHRNLPTVLGPRYDPAARYCMVESHASGRAGNFPARRQARATRKLVDLDPEGSWKPLGEFSDPEVQSSRLFHIYQWVPAPTVPEQEPSS